MQKTFMICFIFKIITSGGDKGIAASIAPLRYVPFLLAGILMTVVPAGCIRAQAIDLSTDEAVLKQIGKQKNKKFSPDDVCIERLKESASVIVIGFFANDVGCRFDGAFVDSQYFEKNDAALSKNALAAFGWEKAPRREREMLADYWVEKGLLAFFTVHREKNEDFQNREFQPPRAVTKENGETVVTQWVQLPSGMRPERKYQLLEYKLAKDGSLSATATLDEFVR